MNPMRQAVATSGVWGKSSNTYIECVLPSCSPFPSCSSPYALVCRIIRLCDPGAMMAAPATRPRAVAALYAKLLVPCPSLARATCCRAMKQSEDLEARPPARPPGCPPACPPAHPPACPPSGLPAYLLAHTNLASQVMCIAIYFAEEE